MLPYSENPKYATKNLLEFIYKYEKVPGLKINVEKSVAFLYTNREQPKKKKLRKLSYYNHIKMNKILGTNHSKEVKSCTRITIRHWWKKLKTTQIDGKIYCDH